MVFLVPSSCYSAMLKKITLNHNPRLLQDPLVKPHVIAPRSNIEDRLTSQLAVQMQGFLVNALKGTVSAHFFTDSWPEFSTIVCKVFSPATLPHKIEVSCYSTSQKALTEMFLQQSLIKNEETVFSCELDDELDETATYLTEYLTSLFQKPFIRDGTASQYCLPVPQNTSHSELLNIRCPDGYVLKMLEPQHAEFVSSHWKYIKSPHKVTWFEERIKRFHTMAAYCCDNPSQPVAWILQYANREIGSLYTVEQHRNKGLALAVTAALCRTVLEESPNTSPYCLVVEGSPAYRLFGKLGFVSCHNQRCFVYLDI